jgi:hypothetical protein
MVNAPNHRPGMVRRKDGHGARSVEYFRHPPSDILLVSLSIHAPTLAHLLLHCNDTS